MSAWMAQLVLLVNSLCPKTLTPWGYWSMNNTGISHFILGARRGCIAAATLHNMALLGTLMSHWVTHVSLSFPATLAYTGFNSSMWIFWGRRREHTQLTRTCFPAAISRPWCLASGLWHTLRVIRMHCSHKHKNCIPRLYWNRSDHLAEHQRSGIQFKNIGFSQAAEWARVTWPKQDAVPWCTVPGIQFNMYSLKAMSVGAKTSCIRILGHARPCPPRWDRAEAISIQSFMSTKLFTSHGRPE